VLKHGDLGGCKAAEADQISARVQPEGGHEESERRGHEEVQQTAAQPEAANIYLLTSCRWIAGKISEILGNEDDVVIELCFNLLEGARFVR